MYGLKLIAVLAVMGGVIAFIGDKLGTRVGKRRLSMFGLRPRHTSVLVTIVTGVLIAAAVLGVLTLASRDVRTALFGMDALRAELTRLSGEVADKNSELENSRSALEAKTAEYSALSVKVKETADQLAAITTELAAVTAERDRTAAALQSIQADYEAARIDLDQAQQEIASLQGTKKQLDARVAALSDSKASLQADVDHLNELTANLKKGMQFVREGVVVFRAGEVLATAVLPGGEKTADTERVLTGIIYKTNQELLARLNVANKDLELLWISKAEFDQAVAALTATPQSFVVRIVSTGNIIYGEPVIGGIELYPNHLIYSQGEAMLSEVMDAGHDQQQAEETVLLFLQKLNATAVKDGVLPDPIGGWVGDMSGAQLYDAVNKVKRYGGKVQITAAAKQDIYAAGPLNIEIRVQEAR